MVFLEQYLTIFTKSYVPVEEIAKRVVKMYIVRSSQSRVLSFMMTGTLQALILVVCRHWWPVKGLVCLSPKLAARDSSSNVARLGRIRSIHLEVCVCKIKCVYKYISTIYRDYSLDISMPYCFFPFICIIKNLKQKKHDWVIYQRNECIIIIITAAAQYYCTRNPKCCWTTWIKYRLVQNDDCIWQNVLYRYSKL